MCSEKELQVSGIGANLFREILKKEKKKDEIHSERIQAMVKCGEAD